VLAHLHQFEDPKSNVSAAMCEDLCVKYFGLRKDGNSRYVVVNMDSSWLTNTGRSYLEQDGNRCLMDAVQCRSCAETYLVNELFSVGFSVLQKLKCFVETSLELTSSHTQWRTITIIVVIARFLQDSELNVPKYPKKLRNLFTHCERCFFELLFLAWRDETTKSFMYIFDSPTAYGLIVDSLGLYLRSGNQKLTHGHLGRITMYMLYTARSDDMLTSRLVQYLDRDSEWGDFFQSLKRFLDCGDGRYTFIMNFKRALEFTFNANWRFERDYVSPVCFVNLMECLGFLASSYLILNGCVFCTKSLLINMLKCRTSKEYLGTCLGSGPVSQDLDVGHVAYSSGKFIFHSIRNLLTNKFAIQDWVRRTNIAYVPILLRLVILLYLVTLTINKVGNCNEVTYFLQRCRIFEDLPLEFSKKIVYSLKLRSRKVGNFIQIFADALAATGNHMVVLGSPKGQLISRNLNAYIITSSDLTDVEKVTAFLCQERGSTTQDEITTCKVTFGNFTIAGVRDNKVENKIEMHLSDENISFWEKFESFQVFMHVQVS
jgi:hypothetical protein